MKASKMREEEIKRDIEIIQEATRVLCLVAQTMGIETLKSACQFITAGIEERFPQYNFNNQTTIH